MTRTYIMKQSDLLKCPFVILWPTHYRDDGTCKCDDPTEQRRMVREWGYTKRQINAALKAQGRATRQESDA
jgi:hypothetical protein